MSDPGATPVRLSLPVTSAWWEVVLAALKAHQVRLIAHVPDQVLAPLVRALEADRFFEVVPLTREEEGVGILVGGYLGGVRGALLLQSSGLGNSVNALGGLSMAYRVPFLLLISPRGRLAEFNPSQVPMGRAVPKVLDALGIETLTLERTDELAEQVDQAARSCFATGAPVALIVSTLLSGGKRG
ncbi:MAG TPA: decarboxylase [Chloroflexota bacterium]|jgi:sulfopyruvate decarboxylase alpha subunit|nr:decarboxylase [Chloroflexota bacterium]